MPSYERVTCATVTGSTHRDTTLRQRLRQLGQKLASRFSTNVYLPKRATLRGKKAYSTACANMKTEKQHIMANLGKAGPSTYLVIESDCETLDVFGPSVQFLVAPQGSDEAPCVIKGTIPPGGSVPIHSHQAIEVFYVLSGNVEVLSEKDGNTHWIAAGPGDFIEVPSGAKHGFRNRSQHPVVQLITTTSKLGRFFQEIGRSIPQGANGNPPSPDQLPHFVRTSERYGYWLATPEENAAAGILLF
jgi:quercetin dioxygenase-like cupin family protein